LTFFKLDNGISIAGYTSKSWTSKKEIIKDSDAMLFNLTHSLSFIAKNTSNGGISCNKEEGPIFGDGEL